MVGIVGQVGHTCPDGRMSQAGIVENDACHRSPSLFTAHPALVIQRAVQRNVLEHFGEFGALDSIADSTRRLLRPGNLGIGPASTIW